MRFACQRGHADLTLHYARMNNKDRRAVVVNTTRLQKIQRRLNLNSSLALAIAGTGEAGDLQFLELALDLGRLDVARDHFAIGTN